MPIVTSTHALGAVQVDGRRYVTEAHTDHLGAVHVIEYLAGTGVDYIAVRAARAVRLNEQLAETETDAKLI